MTVCLKSKHITFQYLLILYPSALSLHLMHAEVSCVVTQIKGRPRGKHVTDGYKGWVRLPPPGYILYSAPYSAQSETEGWTYEQVYDHTYG